MSDHGICLIPFPYIPLPRELSKWFSPAPALRRRCLRPSFGRPKRSSLTKPLSSLNFLRKSFQKWPKNRPQIYQKSISECSLVSTSLFYQFLSTFSLNSETSNPQNHQKTVCFLMFLHIRRFRIYDTLTFDSCQKMLHFGLQNLQKSTSKPIKIRVAFLMGFLFDFCSDVGAHLGSILPPKPLQVAASSIPQWRPERS